MKTAIIIPARYASTRLPGKPLAVIAGKTMLERVVRLAATAAEGLKDVTVTVATDDDRIAKHCKSIGASWVMTRPECPSGTDRVAEAVRELEAPPDFIINMQGDAPLTPPDFLRAMIDSFGASPCDCLTPVTQLSWEALDKLRRDKLTTPFSGTTAIFDEKTGKAFWFSKNIIPAMRKEDKEREKGSRSPVWRHIGLYGYSRAMLQRYVELPESKFEKLEGLEQLRVIENGYTIRCVPVDYRGRPGMSGVDSPEDIVRATKLIAKFGDPLEQKLDTGTAIVKAKIVTRILVARHGNTFGLKDVVTRVGTTDLPLVSMGREQGRKLGTWLKKHDMIPDAIFTSTLKRTQQTADEAQLSMGTRLNLQPLSSFNEIDYGPDENMPEDKVIKRLGKHAIADWEQKMIVPDGWKVDVPAIIRNWHEFAQRIARDYAGKTVLVISSNGILRFAPHLTGDFEGFRAQYPTKMHTGGLGVFENLPPAEIWECPLWNIQPGTAF